MQYLGPLRGAGMLVNASGSLGHVDYELDAYLRRPGEVVASGEIRMTAQELNAVFGRNDLSLKTDDGKCMGIRFSGKQLSATSDVAHADISGGLPPAEAWRR